MNTLPLEIYSELVQYLASDPAIKLSAYASTSRPWQSAVEQKTFRSLKCHITKLDRFEALFASKNICRARNLYRLDIDFGRTSSQQSNSQSETEMFSEDVTRLFGVLADVAGRAKDLPWLTLRFWTNTFKNRDAFDVTLPDLVPALSHVGTFICEPSCKMSKLRRPAVFEILKKLPMVQTANLGFWDLVESGVRVRRAEREELRDAISESDLCSLQELNLAIHGHSIADENWQPQYLLPKNGSNEDPYNRALHHLATYPSLKIIRLTGPLVISSNVLSKMPVFPALVEFQLDFAPATADGQWFFVKDPELFRKIAEEKEGGDSDEESEEETIYVDSDGEEMDLELTGVDELDPRGLRLINGSNPEGPVYQSTMGSKHFRTLPDPSLIPALLLDAARFVESSPQLRRFVLRHRSDRGENPRVSWDHEDMNRQLEVWFLKQGVSRSQDSRYRMIPAGEKFMRSDRLYWRVRNWRPDGDVMKAWERAVGVDAKVFFLNEKFWDNSNQFWPVYWGDLDDELVK